MGNLYFRLILGIVFLVLLPFSIMRGDIMFSIVYGVLALSLLSSAYIMWKRGGKGR